MHSFDHAWQHSRLSVIIFFFSIIWLNTLNNDSKVCFDFFSSLSYDKIYYLMFCLLLGENEGYSWCECQFCNSICWTTESGERSDQYSRKKFQNPSNKHKKRKKNWEKSLTNSLYDPRNKTALSCSSLNWGKFRSSHYDTHSSGIFWNATRLCFDPWAKYPSIL